MDHGCSDQDLFSTGEVDSSIIRMFLCQLPDWVMLVRGHPKLWRGQVILFFAVVPTLSSLARIWTCFDQKTHNDAINIYMWKKCGYHW